MTKQSEIPSKEANRIHVPKELVLEQGDAARALSEAQQQIAALTGEVAALKHGQQVLMGERAHLVKQLEARSIEVSRAQDLIFRMGVEANTLLTERNEARTQRDLLTGVNARVSDLLVAVTDERDKFKALWEAIHARPQA
jgi:TolA-binding protein